MKEFLVKKSKRPAQSYIINLECECGGIFEAVKPIKVDMPNYNILHKCSVCGKVIYVDEVFPCTGAISDSKSEPFGTKVVLG